MQGTRTVAPGVLRVTLAGDDLRDFEAPGPDDHIKLFLPFDGEGRPPMRDYTPMNPRVGHDGLPLLDIDVVLHSGDGIAVPWATSVSPGDPVVIGGPRGSRMIPEDVERFVLIADETALPAVSRWLDQIPAGVPIVGLFAVEHPTIASYLPERNGLSSSWISGADRHTRLATAVRDVTTTAETFVWMAGEATMLLPIRRYFRRESGLRRDQLHAQGYWRIGVAEHDHHAPIDPEDAE